MSQEPNPYLAPTTFAVPPALPSDAETIRRQHLNHEASIKSLGLLYFLGALFMIPGGLLGVVSPSGELPRGTAAIVLALGILSVFLGWGLRKLKAWARVGATVMSVIGLLGFPIGTLINGLALYYLLSKKGSMVFSPQYKEVIADTPHVKYKTSIIVWVLLGIFVLILLVGLAFAVLGVVSGKR